MPATLLSIPPSSRFPWHAHPPQRGPATNRVALGATALLALLLMLVRPVAAADFGNGEPTTSRFVLGAALMSAPEYSGSDTQALKLRPLWAYQYGRLRISTSRAGALMGFGTDTPTAGASVELLQTDRFKFSAGLRIDSGRQASDSSALAGLPDIRRTLRGRVGASYRLDSHWSVGTGLSSDLLGRDGGALAGVDLGYRDRLTEHTEWSAGFGITTADAQYMRTYYGITSDASARSGLTAFRPGAGLRDVHTGIGLTTALDKHWIVFGNVGASKLQGDAAASPLTKSQSSIGGSIGIAYRCCN